MRPFKSILFMLLALPFAAACAFFTYYTIRLAYLNLTVAGISSHRQLGMYIGAVAFPIASVLFGYVCVRCARLAARARRPGQKR
jgi:hypothetical protein